MTLHPHQARFDHARMSPAAVRRSLGLPPLSEERRREITAEFRRRRKAQQDWARERAEAEAKAAAVLADVRASDQARQGAHAWRHKERILAAVCKASGITKSKIIRRDRKRRIAWPRHIACLLIRERCKCDYPTIARHLGRKDHTTAINSVRKARELIATEPAVRAIYDRAVAILEGEARHRAERQHYGDFSPSSRQMYEVADRQ